MHTSDLDAAEARGIAVCATCRVAPRLACALVPAAAIALPVLAFGAARLWTSAEEAAVVRAGLAATDRGQPEAARTTERTIAVGAAALYAERVVRLARDGAEIVVLPEKIIGVTLPSAGRNSDSSGNSRRAPSAPGLM